MIPLAHMKGKSVGVLGLGASGLATAAALRDAGAEVYVWDDQEGARTRAVIEGFEVSDLSDAQILVPTPGIPQTYPAPHPIIAKAQEAERPVFGDIELFAQARSTLPPHQVVGITGTNGKSTTTALLAHIIHTAGRPVQIGGNFGPPILSLEPRTAAYVLELSSFQLEQTYSLECDVAIFLNLTPDHEDRYADMDSYMAAKGRLFDMQAEDATAVVAIDDATGRALADNLPQNTVRVSGRGDISAAFRVNDGALEMDLDGRAMLIGYQADWPALAGTHNAQNAAAAAAAARQLGITIPDIARGLATYEALPHRSQPVGQIDGVRFINDSKATNPDATLKSLQAYDNVHWLAGGSDKGADFAPLAEGLSKVKAAYLYGETKDALAEATAPFPAQRFDDMDAAFAAALDAAEENAVILLSPACASFDQFQNFSARGDHFIALVKAAEAAHVD